jgi:hypothetical protein
MEMLWELTKSSEEPFKKLAEDLLSGRVVWAEVRRECGAFMEAVIDGDVWQAWLRADDNHKQCLCRLFRKYEVYEPDFVADYEPAISSSERNLIWGRIKKKEV